MVLHINLQMRNMILACHRIDVWSSEYDKKDPGIASLGYSLHDSLKESGEMVVKVSKKLLMLSSRCLRLRPDDSGYGLRGLRLGWMPNFMLRIVKQPNI